MSSKKQTLHSVHCHMILFPVRLYDKGESVAESRPKCCGPER